MMIKYVGDLHSKYYFLLRNLISRNLKIRYRKSFFGMFWTLLIPAGLSAVYYTIFYYVLKVKVENYLLIIISGVIPWTFFSTSLASCTESLVGNHSLLNKVPLPVPILPLSEVCTHGINMLLGLPIIIIIKLMMGAAFSVAIVQFIPLLLALFILSYCLGLIMSIIYIYFRDLKYLISLVIQFWFYLTPIMYKASMVPKNYQFLLGLNPIGYIFKGFQAALVDNHWLALNEVLVILGWVLFLTTLSIFIYKKTRNSVIEIL